MTVKAIMENRTEVTIIKIEFIFSKLNLMGRMLHRIDVIRLCV